MVHLFVNPYRDASPQRNAEMGEAMRRNRNCRDIDKIHEISEPARPTIREMLAIARGRVGWADIAVFANSDIYFDETAELLKYIGYQECFALARYEGEQSGEVCFNPGGSQDVWAFRGPPPDVGADFPLGLNGVDSRFNRLLQESGFAVYNPSRSIKTHHLHASAIRPVRTEAEKIPGPYAYIPPCGLAHIRHRPTDAIEKPGRIAIVLLGRFGEIANALPIAMELQRKGHEIFWYVQREFAGLLEGVSYVTPVIWEGAVKLPEAAIEAARLRGFDRILNLQVDREAPDDSHQSANFTTEAWVHDGYLEKYHILPCVLDRPQPPPAEWRPKGEKPILAYCLDGNTSPYAADLKRDMVQWFEKEFSSDFSLLEMDGTKWRPDSLAVVLREAAVLISVDAFPLQMAYAAGTPTIAMTPRGWDGSEPRRNWIEHLNYAQSAMPEGREKIAAALRAVLAGRIEPGKLIVQAGKMPPPRFAQIRSLSILIATQKAHEPYLKILLEHLVPQLKGHEEVEILCETDHGETALWEKRNKLLGVASGEYCCFVDVGDDVGENFIALVVKALRDRPDCVGFKVGRVAAGKVQSVERHTVEFERGEAGPATGERVEGIAHFCPVKIEIARKIGFGPGGDAEYARKLAASGLLEVEKFIEAIIYGKGFSSLG